MKTPTGRGLARSCRHRLTIGFSSVPSLGCPGLTETSPSSRTTAYSLLGPLIPTDTLTPQIFMPFGYLKWATSLSYPSNEGHSWSFDKLRTNGFPPFAVPPPFAVSLSNHCGQPLAWPKSIPRKTPPAARLFPEV